MSLSNCDLTQPIHISTTFLNFPDTFVQNSGSGSGRVYLASFDIQYLQITFIKPNRVSFLLDTCPKSDRRLIMLKKNYIKVG